MEAGIFWSVLMIVSFLFQAADTILKEVIFLNAAKTLKGGSVDLFVLNSYGSAFQAVFICLLLPFLSRLWGIPFHQLPNYLSDGAACFLNIGTLSTTGCEGAPLLPILFCMVNMGYNISLLHLIKISSAVVSSLASTLSGQSPKDPFVLLLSLVLPSLQPTIPMGNCCSQSQPQDGAEAADQAQKGEQKKEENSTMIPPKAPQPTPKNGKQSGNGTVLGRPMEDVRTLYTIGKELGRGQFGVTHLCTCKKTNNQFACKTIAKRKLANKDDIEDVRREVQIMHHLAGQNNIVELKGAFEDKHSVHLVMELCGGGELFDRIIAKGHYTERAAASLLRTIVQIVHTCHSMGVIHRDFKPENFLLLNKDEDAPLKATDFGLSVFYKQGEIFKDIVGSAYYIAPEVLKRKYGPEADIWSIGVMLYILLSGIPPFWAESEHGIFNAILRGHIDFTSDPWPSISPAAKDLVKKMLNSDPKQRLTAHQVLSHPWIMEDGEAPDTPLDNAVLGRLKQFKAMNNFKKVALRVIAGCLSEEEIMGLKKMFKGMDSDNSGTITLEELKRGLSMQGTRLTEAEVKQLMEAADADGNGTIDYEEFITATMHLNRMDREDHLYTAFQYFDKDNSGYITIEELEQALRDFGMGDDREIKEVISDVDSDHDGRINYDEFVAMMRSKTQADTMNPKKLRQSFVAK